MITDAVLGTLDVQTLHASADVAQLDVLPIHMNVAVLADRDQQVAGLFVLGRHGLRLKTVTPVSLMNDVVMMKKISRLMQKSRSERGRCRGLRCWRVPP